MTAPATPCLIALGSNLGDRLANLRDAVAALDRLDGLEITAISALYETAPVGGPDDQGPFYNAALAAASTIGPRDLLAELHRIEADHHRQRAVHWGPRTLDLDLLVAGDAISERPDLLLPHPRMHERRFVLDALPVEPGDLTAVAADWPPFGDGTSAAR